MLGRSPRGRDCLAAVGARNFPAYGSEGEEAFRGAFDEALASLGASVPDGGAVVDLGCGTGISTRRIAANFPRAASVIGMDLSPHFLAVGRRLLNIGRDKRAAEWRWVNDINGYGDARVELRRGLAEATGLPLGVGRRRQRGPRNTRAASRSDARRRRGGLRILRPGGELWVTEMDFETPAFAKLRANPLLFSLIRSTEPYLDLYADYQPNLAGDLVEMGFTTVQLAAATGRHFALRAVKRGDTGAQGGQRGTIDDRRQETAKEDTHLKTWESKQQEL